ncbi:unnamed protein product [Absidia cylindrospora]
MVKARPKFVVQNAKVIGIYKVLEGWCSITSTLAFGIGLEDIITGETGNKNGHRRKIKEGIKGRHPPRYETTNISVCNNQHYRQYKQKQPYGLN